MPIYKEDINEQVLKARKIIKNVDCDSFYTMNCPICSFIGTLIMWFSLCHIYSGLSLSVYTQRYQCELAFLNCLVAGGCGGLGALGMKKALDMQYWAKYKSVGTKFKLKSRYDFNT